MIYFFVGVGAALILIFAISIHKYKILYENEKRLREANSAAWSRDKSEFNQKIEELHKELNQSKDSIITLTQQVGQDQLDEQIINHQQSLEDQLQQLQTQLDELNNVILIRTNALAELEARSQQLTQENETNQEALDKVKMALAEKEVVHDNIRLTIEQLKTSNHEATLRAFSAADGLSKTSRGWLIELGNDQRKLIELLDEIKMNYPQVFDDVATIEWRKVWMGLIQNIAVKGALDKVSGIYRLVVVDENWYVKNGLGRVKKDNINSDDPNNYNDPNQQLNQAEEFNELVEVCYIGQAVNVKERWYEHIKKLVGADKKGNEKLYNKGLRPDQLRWEVVEEYQSMITVVDDNGVTVTKANPIGRTEWLNEREHYWIEFYAASEVGLNSKK